MNETTRDCCVRELLAEGGLSTHCFEEFTREAMRTIRSQFPNHLTEEEIKDLAQATVIKAWQQRSRCEAAGSFAKWLRGVAKHTALEYWRQTKKARQQCQSLTRPALPDGTRADVEPPAPDDPQAAVIDAAMERYIDDLLTERLTPRESAIYQLRREEMQHKEISAKLNIGLDASKKGLERVKKKALELFDFLPRGGRDE